ncbi:MAG: hypothetical protein A2Y07_06485 [Planctomycetes bacterium GWF2_50_10]|nr:MAG: hypothetical protein A2Y07_06485 [Planctomycetes bacterium GWF2_50_10]
MEKHRRGHPKRGFTLVELLVVISIIALLLAILVPSLTKARQSAQKVVCGNNLRQIGLGYAMYLNENRNKVFKTFYDCFKPAIYWANNGAAWHVKEMLIGHVYVAQNRSPVAAGSGPVYISDPKVFKCPSDKNFNKATSWEKTSYGYNTYLSFAEKENQLKPLQYLMTFYDHDWTNSSNTARHGGKFSSTQNQMYDMVDKNMLMFDTHVEYVKMPYYLYNFQHIYKNESR